MPEEKNLYYRPHYPLLIVISGPSGVGKDTIARLVMEHADTFHFVVTTTTRKPREGEVDGRDYIFVSHDEFARLIEEDELLEHAIVYNDYKGVSKEQVRQALATGKDVILRVDIQGAATVKKLAPHATLIFLMTESEEALVQRLKDRKSETPEGLSLRIATARQEMKRMNSFDYYVINAKGKQEQAVADIIAIVAASHLRTNGGPITL